MANSSTDETTNLRIRGKRRSKCPTSCALDIIGDKWTMIVVRDLRAGKSRFKEFSESAENIPTNILSERLDRLITHRIIQQVPVTPSSKRMGYKLTAKGVALYPVLDEMAKWALRWEDCKKSESS